MRLSVDPSRCQGHAMCSIAATDLFRLDDADGHASPAADPVLPVEVTEMSMLLATDVPFDHHSLEYATNWRDINAALRLRCPVAHGEVHGGFWLWSKCGDVAVATGDAIFSALCEVPDVSHQGAAILPGEMCRVASEMDLPEFHDCRTVLDPAFSPPAVKKWEPYVRAVGTVCIDQFIESSSCDPVRDLGSSAPAIPKLELLGGDKGDGRTFSGLTYTMIYTASGEDSYELALQRIAVLLAQICMSIAPRRDAPTDDLISRLAPARQPARPVESHRFEVFYLRAWMRS